jgi:hypothetical protein
MPEQNDDLTTRLQEIEKLAASSGSPALQEKVAAVKQRIISIQEGKETQAESTNRVDKTFRLTLLVGIPVNMDMQEIMREIGQIETRLNAGGTKLSFKLEK